MIIAKILGVVLLVFWVCFIPVGRHWCRRLGGLMYATVFQWHVLPFIVGVGLIISGSIWFVFVLPGAWVLSRMFPNFFMFVFPLVTGWVYGGLIYSSLGGNSKVSYYLSSVTGVVFMFLVCTVVTAIVVGPERVRNSYSNKGED